MITYRFFSEVDGRRLNTCFQKDFSSPVSEDSWRTIFFGELGCAVTLYDLAKDNVQVTLGVDILTENLRRYLLSKGRGWHEVRIIAA